MRLVRANGMTSRLRLTHRWLRQHNSDMERSESTWSGGSAAAFAVAIVTLVILPLLYVASIGPAVWLADRGLISTDEDSGAALFYRPLEIVVEHCEPVEEGLELYVSLWESDIPVYPQF